MLDATLPTINDIRCISTPGSWPTKSGGTLEVVTRIDFDTLNKFLTYNSDSLAAIDEDIRGLRVYKVSNIPKGSICANEWHIVRTELFTVLKGSIKWTCTDSLGNTTSYIVTASNTIFTPHHILHRYEALEDNTDLAVIANTLFLPDQPSTHDTYSAELFHELQASHR